MVSQKPKYCKRFERNSHWRKLSMIMVRERYCNASPKPEFFLIFFVYIFIHISANMSLFGLKFSQMILHTETSKLMYNWSFLFEVLHKPTFLPSTFKRVYSLDLMICCIDWTCFWRKVDLRTSHCKSSLCMHGEKIHAYGMSKLEAYCAYCGLAVSDCAHLTKCL